MTPNQGAASLVAYHAPTVRSGWVRYTGGQVRTEWSPPIPLDQARDWAHEAADGETIYSASFTHLDGSVSPMYVSAHGMARQNNHRHDQHR